MNALGRHVARWGGGYAILLLGMGACQDPPKAAPSESVSAAARYAAIEIRSDPVGAHVYVEGKYWGQTSDGTPLRGWVGSTGGSSTFTFVAKMPGYSSVTEQVTLRLPFDDKSEAQSSSDRQVVMLVLDTE